jgi:hypothetical protein
MDNDIIFKIGTSNKNNKIIEFFTKKDYSKKWYIYPFGDTKVRFLKNDPFKIEYLKQENKIIIRKIAKNSKYLWDDGWKINLKLWYPHHITNFMIPDNYGKINLCNVEKKYYKYGLVIPFFNRANYVKFFLESLKKSDLSDCITVFVDESMTKDVNDDQILVNNMIINYEMPNLIKIFKNNHSNMYDSILTGWDMLYPFCEYLITLDSDTIMKTNWINKINESYESMKKDFENNEFIICSGFNVVNSQHSVIKKNEKYILKNSVGGCNIFFKKNIYPDYIRRTLISYKWDTNIITYINELNGVIGTTNPSVIQHIGEISSGHRIINKKKNKVKFFDKSIDYDEDESQLDSVKNDFSLEKKKSIEDETLANVSETPKEDENPADVSETPKEDEKPADVSETPKEDEKPADVSETPKEDENPADVSETPKEDENEDSVVINQNYLKKNKNSGYTKSLKKKNKKK